MKYFISLKTEYTRHKRKKYSKQARKNANEIFSV